MRETEVFMFKFISFLGNAWDDPAFNWEKHNLGWLVNLFNVLYPLLYAIMAVTAAAGAVYAIVLGINLARAEDQSKRDEAKKRLITTIIAVAVTILLIVFFNELLPLIIQQFVGTPDKPTDHFGTTE